MVITDKNSLLGLDDKAVAAWGATVNDTQALWLSGYFYGLFAAKSGQKDLPQTQATVENPTLVAEHTPPPLTVLYGSQTGNSKKAAQMVADKAKHKGFEVNLADMNDYTPQQLKNEKRLLVVVSTQGEGEPPSAAETLYAFLHGARAPKLPDLQFSVLALGDKSYLHFCKTGQDFDQKLAELGGKRLFDRADCDVDFHDVAETWAEGVLATLAQTVPAAAPQVALKSVSMAPPMPQFDRKKPLQATVLDKIQLNGRGSVKETWHVELSLEDSGLTYQPGDALAVYATNSERLVAEVLKAGRVNPSEKVQFDGQEGLLGDILMQKAELSVLTRDVLAQYHTLSQNAQLKAILDDPTALQNYIYGRDVADLLVDFPTDALPPQYLANILRKMPPRAYSIASSLAAHPDEVHLTVGAVRYKAQGRKKEGVASSFLADRVAVGEKVAVFVEENAYFKLPNDPNADIIMVGPGTGIAPFRAFVEQRSADNAKGKNWLFFGNPNFETDFLYQTEWQQYLKKGVLSRLDVAFSRDQAEKVYVQHKLLQKSKQVFEWLDNGAHFYVCGDKNRMARDVEQALVAIVAKEAALDVEKAAAYVKDLRKQRRYLEDIY